jgi:hypothetical protein
VSTVLSFLVQTRQLLPPTKGVPEEAEAIRLNGHVRTNSSDESFTVNNIKLGSEQISGLRSQVLWGSYGQKGLSDPEF